uniref:Epithelial membrane protein 3 n=1 Tax=Astyanax mexicanus TaxID=7994 RepID=A0A8B9J6M4_ASTMX
MYILLKQKTINSKISISLSGLSAFAAVLIYTFQREEILQDILDPSKGRFGYCFILAWVCVPLLLCSGVLYMHLKKSVKA